MTMELYGQYSSVGDGLSEGLSVLDFTSSTVVFIGSKKRRGFLYGRVTSLGLFIQIRLCLSRTRCFSKGRKDK